ncbi:MULTISPECIES: sigma D regulator [unclassified Ferrimonas]|uniref:sigma D regulator n=1 Tax=unclassified Ferrimonas TaxID=2620587 RepID=UPI0025731383|nr:sigma D regulator [Ferrimonas sp. YFM]BDY06647.1 sigma D regulator [Ferrimonas sp. YFM]
MLTRLQNAVEQWGGKNTLIDQWLNNRRQLLIHYCQLANLPPYDSAPHLPDPDGVHHFCNLLVDYVSEGHFEVYDQVVSECEKHGEECRQLASRIVPQIAKSTDVALDFNDKFGVPFDEDDERMMELDESLSRLGQAMEERFAFEDKLLDTLHRHYSEELQPQP